MGILFHDLRFAFRQLKRTPGFTITAVLTLALGIGANTAIFSLVNAVLFKPLPVADPQQITTLTYRQNHGSLQRPFSLSEFRAIRAQSQTSFSDIMAVSAGLDGFAGKGPKPERVMTAYVSGNFFDALGVRSAAGRLFLRSEGEVLDSDPVVVLDYDFWKARFNGDPNVVGREVTVNGHPLSVIGVAPEGFRGLPSIAVTVAAYLPLSQLPLEGTPADVLNRWQTRSVLLYGRLRPGFSLKQADAELNVAAQNLMHEQPDDEKQLELAAYSEQSLRIGSNPSAIVLISALFLGLAGMVLLLACVNVANLVLARATAREREMAIRAALGANRSRLLRQMITESVTLALIGGAVGVVLGMSVSAALSHVNLHLDLPFALSVQFDWRIFLYSLGMAVLAGIVVGIVPALRMAKANVNTVLHTGGRGTTAGRHWMRDTLTVLQIAGSLVMLVVAGLFVRSLGALQTTDFGFQPDHVLNLSFATTLIGINDSQTRDLTSNIQAHLHKLPGVIAVSQASEVPMGYFNGTTATLTIDGVPAPVDAPTLTAGYNVVSPEYFNVMGIGLLSGRGFTDGDDERSRDVTVISEGMAKKYWPNEDPIGHTFRMASEKTRGLEVVGIARDVEISSTRGDKSQPYFYLPYAQHVKGNDSIMTLQLKTQRDPLALATTAEKTIHEISPELPVFQVQSMREALYSFNGFLPFQLGATLAATMGGLGLTLAVIGLYGLISYAVSQRVQEIGVRMALGATRGSVFGMIYRQSMRIVAVGLGIGLVAALLVAQAVGSLIIVSPWDPVTFATVISALVLVALASCYPPARRAMAVEPMVALRQD